MTVERFFAHCCHQNYRFCEETWEINSDNIVYLCSSRLVQCYLLLFKIISIYNWAKVGTMYSKMGGRGELRNSKNLPRWAAEFGKQCCGIWKICRGKLWALIITAIFSFVANLGNILAYPAVVCVCMKRLNTKCTEPSWFLVWRLPQRSPDPSTERKIFPKTGYRTWKIISCYYATVSHTSHCRCLVIRLDSAALGWVAVGTCLPHFFYSTYHTLIVAKY